MNPESITTGLITAHRRRRHREPEPGAPLRHHPLDRGPISTRHGPQPEWDAEARRHRQLPVFLPQLERHIQGRLAYTQHRAGHRTHEQLLWFAKTFRSLLASARSHSLFVVNP